MHGWPSIWGRRKWVSRRIVYSLLTNCSEMSVFGSYWKTWYFVVCEQACFNKTDQILWQTLGAFDIVHSSHKWIQAILVCGKHSTTMQIRVVSRLWFCRRHWRFKINISRNSLHFRTSHVRANKLDVQETDFSFTQFHRSWNHFSRCRFTHGLYSRSHILRFGNLSISFRTEQNWWTQERATGNPSAVVKPNMHSSIPIKHTNVIPTNIDHIPSNTTHSGPSARLYVFEDKRQ